MDNRDLLQTFSFYLMHHMDLFPNKRVTLKVWFKKVKIFLSFHLFFFLSTRIIYTSLGGQPAANEVLTFQSGTLNMLISQHSLGKQKPLLMRAE